MTAKEVVSMCNYLFDKGHNNVKFGGKTVVGYKLVENHNNGYYSFFLMKKITEVME